MDSLREHLVLSFSSEQTILTNNPITRIVISQQLVPQQSTMIRLPPTSISISENDVQFHLRQTEILHGLLKQGFKKNDVARYLDDYRKATAEAEGHDLDFLVRPAPTAVELACCRSQPPSMHELDQTSEATDKSDPSSTPKSISSNLGTLSKDVSLTNDPNNELKPTDYQDIGREESVSPLSMAPTMLINKHAPRKSSLLRFAKAASPDDCSLSPEEGAVLPDPIITRRAAEYEHRSETNPYQASTRDNPVVDSSPQDSIVERINRMSLSNSTDVSEDMPFMLPPPFSATPRAHSFQYSSLASSGMVTRGDGNPERRVDSSPSLETTTPLRSIGFLDQYATLPDLSSSPRLPASPADDDLTQLRASSISSGLPATPTPIRAAAPVSSSEPRHHRHRYLDGNAFSVYNDSLPSSSQPQTPADLARGPVVTERDAAYTAPPGMIRVASSSTSIVHGSRWDRTLGEQSPTVRAISLRERRNRELLRSVRAEGIRLRRMRLRDESLFTQRAAQSNRDTNANPDLGAQPQISLPDDIWRDDLNADRIGEENFEADAEVSQRRVMRVVSGNARFEAWEGGNDR